MPAVSVGKSCSVAFLLFLCVASPSLPPAAVDAQVVPTTPGALTDTLRGSYRLMLVGGRPPDVYRDEGLACDVPSFSLYEFAGERWTNLDTIPTTEACSEPISSRPGPYVRADTGYYRVRGDTVHLYVRDERIGVRGWINFGLIKSDTLLFLGGEFDPGDFVYVRNREDVP